MSYGQFANLNLPTQPCLMAPFYFGNCSATPPIETEVAIKDCFKCDTWSLTSIETNSIIPTTYIKDMPDPRSTIYELDPYLTHIRRDMGLSYHFIEPESGFKPPDIDYAEATGRSLKVLQPKAGTFQADSEDGPAYIPLPLLP